MADAPHFALPFQWTRIGTELAALETEQESIEEITDCVEVIVRTQQGQRTSLPEFGRPALEFNTDPHATEAALANAILEWEPRVTALIDAYPDPADESVQLIRALISPGSNEEGDYVVG